MRSDESRVSKSRASSPDGRGVTPPISEPFPINPQTSASPNAGQPLAMQKRVRQTIITQQHNVQLAFFRNAGLSAELCRLVSFHHRLEFPELLERKLDLILERDHEASGAFEYAEDLDVEKLFDEHLLVVAGVTSPWAGRRKISLAELSDAPWILPAN